jgi:phage terminase small subunit
MRAGNKSAKSTDPFDNITPQQAKFIQELITSPNIGEAAKATGINGATASKWFRDTTFLAAYRLVRRNLVEQTSSFIVSQMREAAKYVLDVMKNPMEKTAYRLKAAEMVLERGYTVLSIDDVLQQVQELQQALAEVREQQRILNGDEDDGDDDAPDSTELAKLEHDMKPDDPSVVDV